MKSNYDEFRAYYIMKNGIDSWKTFELLSDQALINILDDVNEIRNLFPKFFSAYKSGYIYNWNFFKKDGAFWENEYSDFHKNPEAILFVEFVIESFEQSTKNLNGYTDSRKNSAIIEWMYKTKRVFKHRKSEIQQGVDHFLHIDTALASGAEPQQDDDEFDKDVNQQNWERFRQENLVELVDAVSDVMVYTYDHKDKYFDLIRYFIVLSVLGIDQEPRSVSSAPIDTSPEEFFEQVLTILKTETISKIKINNRREYTVHGKKEDENPFEIALLNWMFDSASVTDYEQKILKKFDKKYACSNGSFLYRGINCADVRIFCKNFEDLIFNNEQEILNTPLPKDGRVEIRLAAKNDVLQFSSGNNKSNLASWSKSKYSADSFGRSDCALMLVCKSNDTFIDVAKVQSELHIQSRYAGEYEAISTAPVDISMVFLKITDDQLKTLKHILRTST